MQVRITFPKANKQLNLIPNHKTSHHASIKPPIQLVNPKRKHKTRLKTAMTALSVGKDNNKSISSSKSKSKSKSKEDIKVKCTLDKENTRAKDKNKTKEDKERKNKKSQSKSKSKTKIYRTSPINTKPDCKMYNTSPILQKSARVNSIKINKNSPDLREDYKYAKGAMPHRDFQHACQTISTKLNTQRTPMRSNLGEKDVKIKSKPSKKTKTLKNQQLKKKDQTEDTIKIDKKKKKIKQDQGHSELMSEHNLDSLFKKNKKQVVREINTQGPQRKQSYFDKQIYEKLNLDNAEFFRRKKHLPPHSSQSPTQISEFQQHHTHQIAQTPLVSYRQFGTETSPTEMHTSHQTSKKQAFSSSPAPKQQSEHSQHYATQQNNAQYLNRYRGHVMATDLQAFRKQQELKWRVMCLQLTLLKQTTNRTPQKIDQLIEELGHNISQFQTKCKEIEQEPFHSFQNSNHQINNSSINRSRRINNYVMESPAKIKSIMEKSRKSSCSSIIDILPHDSSLTIKNQSDKKLLKQLQCMEHVQDADHDINRPDGIRQDQQSDIKNGDGQDNKGLKQLNSQFCMELQKQLESYSQTNIKVGHRTGFMAMELEHIPEMEYAKSIMIVEQIESRLLIELCEELVQSSQLLHSYLICCKNNPLHVLNQSHPIISGSSDLSSMIAIQHHPPTSPVAVPKPAFPTIKCSQAHSISLTSRLFTFLQQHPALTEAVLQRVTIPTGNSMHVSLQLLRNYFMDSEDELYVQEDNDVELVLDAMIIEMFETNCEIYVHHQQHQQQEEEDDQTAKVVQMQYFYNHCIYNAINQILNSIRPPNPTSERRLRAPPSNLSTLFNRTLHSPTELLGVRMGYEPAWEEDFNRNYESSCARMDRCIVREEEDRWSKIEDDVFEEKYILAQGVIEWIISEEIMMLYNEFM